MHVALIGYLNRILLPLLIVVLLHPVVLAIASLVGLGKVDLLVLVVQLVVLDDLSDHFSNVLFVCHLFENGGDSIQLHIRHVIVPGRARDGVLRLEEVSDWRVVHDDHISHWPSEPGQVLHKGVVEVGAVLSEQFVPAVALGVQLPHQRFGVFRKRSGKHDKFVVFGHPVQEFSYTRPHKDVDLADVALDFNGKDDVWVVDLFELGVDKGLIEVKDECLLANVRLSLRTDEIVLL